MAKNFFLVNKSGALKTKLLLILSGITVFAHSQNWMQLSDFPGGARDDGTAFTIGDSVFCGTGFKAGAGCTSDFYSFDTGTNNWTTIASLPSGKERQYSCGFSNDSEGFVFGGIDAFGNELNDLWKYAPSLNAWTPMTSRPGAGIYGAAHFVVNGKAYIIGGSNGSTTASSEVWEYDMPTDSWTQKNNLPFNGGFRASGCQANNKGYLLFGRDLNGVHRKHLYEYDDSLDSWTQISSFPDTGRIYAAMQSISNELIVFGGVDSLNNHYGELWTYNLSSGPWTQKNSIPSFDRKGGMCFAAGNSFFYTCGIDQSNNRIKETWRVDLFVGIREENNDTDLTIYPNPAKDRVKITLSEKGSFSYSITNLMGEIVQEGEVLGDEIQLKDISTGIYQVKITGSKKNLTKRLVIH
jgi:N-acetylneuraminic acid mutarotase